MRQSLLILGLVLTFMVENACSTKNAGEAYSEMSDDDKAKQALDEGRYDDAISQYDALVTSEPEDYSRYPLLAAAYAARAGIDILNSLSSTLQSSGGGSAFDTLGNFVPSSPSDDQMSDVEAAIATLEKMPSDHRNGDGTYAYSAGAALQYTLFQTMHSVMIMNRFAVKTSSGAIDPASLEQMTDAEVDAILDGLTAAATASPDNLQGQAVSTVINQTMAGVDAQDGTTRKEKLIAYMGKSK